MSLAEDYWVTYDTELLNFFGKIVTGYGKGCAWHLSVLTCMTQALGTFKPPRLCHPVLSLLLVKQNNNRLWG